MSYNVRQSDNPNELAVSGSLNIDNVYRLREVMLDSIMRVDSIVFTVDRFEDVSFACLQLLCASCRRAHLLKKEFRIECKEAVGFSTIASLAGFPSANSCIVSPQGCVLTNPR